MEYFFARPKNPNENYKMERYGKDKKVLPYYIKHEDVLKDVINHNLGLRYTKIPVLQNRYVTCCDFEDSLFPTASHPDEAGNCKKGQTLKVHQIIQIGSVYVLIDNERELNARLQGVRLATDEEIQSYEDEIHNGFYQM